MLKKLIDWLEWLGLFLPEVSPIPAEAVPAEAVPAEAVRAVGVIVRAMEKHYEMNLLCAADMVDDHNAERRQGEPDFFDTGVYFELELSTDAVRGFRLAYNRLKALL